MKIFYPIIIILLVITSLYFMKDDVISVLGNVSTYINKNITSPVIKLTEKEKILPSKVDMPGALRVVDSILNPNDKKVELSQDNIIALTNAYRKESGNLPALKENSKLNLSAQKKLQDMFSNQYFEHLSKEGKGVGDLGEEAGYQYILIGENLAMGNFKDDQSLVNAWIASKGHRENILNKNYTEIGVAVAKGMFEGKNIWMAVQHFGTPRSSCPSIDPILLLSINKNQNEIKDLEEELTIRLDMINKRVVYEGESHYDQIDKYNSLVNTYNDLIKDTKEKINVYNNQIRAFNNCLISLSN
ncbi:MAG TPA: CAP domain-containing protein [Candidatus Paceibacterota bacterium]|nr:CAP domain-containing protein [Candidatus Paceibacterota bacterium]